MIMQEKIVILKNFWIYKMPILRSSFILKKYFLDI